MGKPQYCGSPILPVQASDDVINTGMSDLPAVLHRLLPAELALQLVGSNLEDAASHITLEGGVVFTGTEVAGGQGWPEDGPTLNCLILISSSGRGGDADSGVMVKILGASVLG